MIQLTQQAAQEEANRTGDCFLLTSNRDGIFVNMHSSQYQHCFFLEELQELIPDYLISLLIKPNNYGPS